MAAWLRQRYPRAVLALRYWWLSRRVDMLACRILLARWFDRAIVNQGGLHALREVSRIDGARPVLRSAR
ncbi:MAG: hypothetical protein FJ245_07585 [Nitrospira sp.]|nr:hypothetical protein [Nitrospira sp.]